MKNLSARRLALCAVLAAVYAALTIATAAFSYGTVQFRIAEALCVLPALFPFTAWGLFVGCILANLVSPGGILDVIFGALATLACCGCAAAIGKGGRSMGHSIAVCLMPVAWNAVVIGAVLAVTAGVSPENSAPLWVFFLAYAAEVALGEAVVMFALGLPLLRFLPKSRWYPLLAEKLDIRE